MERFQVITTKVKPPAIRRAVFPRPDLLQKLGMLLTGKIAVIQGGAGSGKTTLVTSFLAEQPNLTCPWITLDETNNDLFSFWYYIFEVLKPKDGQNYNLHHLIQLLPQKQEMESILIAFINVLELKTPTILVLDDFHHIKDQGILKSLEFFLKHSPNNLYFALLTRETPKLNLGDWMISGQYVEITNAELKFSKRESELFLRKTLDLDLTQGQIEDLHKTSEGWPGGLQLLALTIAKDRQTQIQTINPHMIHYLSNEILNKLENHERDFLVTCSILTSLDAKLCEVVTGRQDAGFLLEKFNRQNLFLINLDNLGQEFRFHNLFAEFLKKEFANLSEKRQIELHLKAAQILEQRGNFEESIRHRLKAKDYRQALNLMAKTGPSLAYWSYLKQIPLKDLIQNEEMAFQRLFYHYCNLEIIECGKVLTKLEPQSQGVLKSIYQLFLYIVLEKPLKPLEKSDWLEEVEELDWNLETKSMLYVTFPMLLSLIDNYQDALRCVQRGEILERQLNNPYIRYFVLNFQAQIKETLGELRECEEIYEKMFHLLDQHPIIKHLKSNAYIGLAGVLLAQMRLDEAQRWLAKAESIIDPGLVHLERAVTYNKMEIAILAGRSEEALQLIEELGLFSAQDNFWYQSALLKYFLILKDKMPGLDRKFPNQPHHKPSRISDQLIYARFLFSEGKTQGALSKLTTVITVARQGQIKSILVEALLLKASILSKDPDQTGQGVVTLVQEAVENSFYNNLQAPFFLEEELIRNYLALLNPKSRSWLQKLVTEPKPYIPLTKREIEVLEVLATGASNQEIATSLHISLATVKSHLINIYSKLHVTNRVEAVTKALDLGLVSET